MGMKGKILYPDACAPPGKAKADGGSSFGKKAKLNKSGLETAMTKCKGTPKDKGVNR
jgi:hypothetical protein